eukprot:2409998-Prymnesium_polylepis.1
MEDPFALLLAPPAANDDDAAGAKGAAGADIAVETVGQPGRASDEPTADEAADATDAADAAVARRTPCSFSRPISSLRRIARACAALSLCSRIRLATVSSMSCADSTCTSCVEAARGGSARRSTTGGEGSREATG